MNQDINEMCDSSMTAARNLNVEKLMRAAFDEPRLPRSDEYKAGVRAALEFRIEGKQIRIPYHLGGAKADAFFFGQEEGHAIWRTAMEKSA